MPARVLYYSQVRWALAAPSHPSPASLGLSTTLDGVGRRESLEGAPVDSWCLPLRGSAQGRNISMEIFLPFAAVLPSWPQSGNGLLLINYRKERGTITVVTPGGSSLPPASVWSLLREREHS